MGAQVDVRPGSAPASPIPKGDYVSEGLSVVILDELFPNLIVGDKSSHPWPYLRREVPHNWYCDRRNPEVGFLNRDEVMILYNLALQFKGKRGLEIGCWMGWSTCHLALAGLELDVIDPALANPENEASIKHALEGVGALDKVRLLVETSPQAVERLAAIQERKWNFFFIDGDHGGSAPESDARTCLRYAAEDALFVFHDLNSPDVARGLGVLCEAGFHTLIYQTMQIVGVAWRGNVTPVDHIPDPAYHWDCPDHLAGYPIAGENPGVRLDRLQRFIGIANREGSDKDSQMALLVQRAAKADELTGTIAERDRVTAQLREQVRSLEESQLSLDTKLVTFEAALRETRTALDDKHQEIALLTERLRETDSRSSEAELATNHLQTRLDRIHGSLSWKLTSPLRELRRLVGKIAKLGNGPRPVTADSPTSPTTVELKPDTFRNFVKRYRLLRHSPLFDRSFYRWRYRDVAAARFGRFWHYLLIGARELRQPNALFDPQWYLSENPEVAAHRQDPVLHYLESGWKEGRNPHALFNIRYYLASNPQVARAGVEPLSHFLQAGARDARSPSASFDMLYYQAEHPDVVTSGMNPLVHYVTRGAALKYRPHPLFDSDSSDATTDLTNADHALAANDRIKDPTATCEPDLMENLDPGRGVCIVTPDFIGPVKNGGIGTACYHYARTLVAAGYPVTVLFTGLLSGSQSTHWRRHYAKQRITFLWVGDLPPIPHVIYGGSWFLERSQQILIFLAQQHFSFIHFQDWQANGFWSIRAKQLGYALRDSVLTVMMHSSTRWIDQGMQQYPKDATAQVRLDFCETYCMRHCDILLSPSQHMFDWAAANSIELAEDRMLVPYLQSNPIEQSVMLPPDAGHVIFFGRLETRKGLHIFADALRLLKKQSGDVPVRVSLLGKHSTVNGVSSEEVIADLQREIPETKFTVIDNFDSFEALNYIKRSRGLVVVASLLDNYPYAVLECIEHHLPFIAAAVGGIPEMVDERVLFSPSPDQLATVLGSRRSLNHATLRHKYVPEVARDRWLTLHDRTNLPLQQPETREEKVSVCVAYYNHGRYLENLIQAFQAQDYADFEVIVVNDGSTGYSASEFDRVTHNCTDERFQFISTENHGPGAARNLAVSLSTGSYLIFFDSDNLPKDNSLISRLVKAVNVSRADCITVPYDMVDENCAAPSDTNVIGIYRPLGSCVVLGFSENVFGDTTMIIRKPVFGQLGGFSTDRECAEDHEFLLRLAIRGFRLEVYPESLLYYRVSRLSRYRSSNRYKIFESLMAQLAEAPPSTLLNIVERVALPLVLASRQ